MQKFDVLRQLQFRRFFLPHIVNKPQLGVAQEIRRNRDKNSKFDAYSQEIRLSKRIRSAKPLVSIGIQ